VYWTSINISCNRETLEICKTIRIVILNSLNSFFSIMNVLIDSLILKTLNRVLDIELTYRVTRNLFKLVKQLISSFQIHWSWVFTSWKIFYQLLFLFLFHHRCLNTSINISCNRETLEICKTIRIVIELTYRVTRNLFKLVKQLISSFQIHWSWVFTSWKIFHQLLFLFLFHHRCLNRFINFKYFK
jgi:hypothetical protein